MKVSAEDDHLFDYSETEWAKIEASMRPLIDDILLDMVSRDGPLSAFQHSKLLEFGRTLLRSRLLDAVHIYQQSESESSSRAEFERARRKALQTVYKIRKAFSVVTGKKVRMSDYRPKPKHSITTPITLYEWLVLQTWVHFGGKLRLSRHPKTGKVKGPLARFFFAVVRPVMGDRTPSPESLPHIVRRQERLTALIRSWISEENDIQDLVGP